MSDLHRRGFLTTSATLAGLSALNATAAADKPNEKIRMCVMGVRGRGRALLQRFARFEDVEITQICEIDDNVVPRALQDLAAIQERRPRVQKDIRRVLEDRNLDAVVVAAPDHWHALATVWACQAGKHVYVEKPASHNVIEGRRMVEAARRHNRVVQVGTQRRSSTHFQSARELVRSGRLGKIPFVRTWIAGNRPSIGRRANAAVPQGVDYNLWLGPAPEHAFNPNRFHYEWHWFWDYGTGEIGNNGIHALDMVRGMMNLNDPIRIHSGGGMNFYDDDRQTPDTQVATYDFADTTVIWEHRIWSRTGFEDAPWGIVLYGQNGNLIFDHRGWRVENGFEASDRATDMETPHTRNFLDCVKNGNRPNADIEEGHLSTRLCHFGNIAYRTQRTLRFQARTENFVDDAQANQMLGRTYRRPFVLPERV